MSVGTCWFVWHGLLVGLWLFVGLLCDGWTLVGIPADSAFFSFPRMVYFLQNTAVFVHLLSRAQRFTPPVRGSVRGDLVCSSVPSRS